MLTMGLVEATPVMDKAAARGSAGYTAGPTGRNGLAASRLRGVPQDPHGQLPGRRGSMGVIRGQSPLWHTCPERVPIRTVAEVGHQGAQCEIPAPTLLLNIDAPARLRVGNGSV